MRNVQLVAEGGRGGTDKPARTVRATNDDSQAIVFGVSLVTADSHQGWEYKHQWEAEGVEE